MYLCHKSKTHFKRSAYSNERIPDNCYYHDPRNNHEGMNSDVIRIILADGYACKMIIPFLKNKKRELENV